MTEPAKKETGEEIEALLHRFEAYDPAARLVTTPFWPPAVRPARWNGNRRDVSANAIHYDRVEVATLLHQLDALGVARGRVLISDFYSGLSSLLWGEVFQDVHAISVRPFPERRLNDGRFSIFFGRVGDMPFMYEVADQIGRLDALLIDGTVRYDLVMILYYTFRRLVSPGGIVIFSHTAPDDDPLNGVARFITDLRSGEADGIAHRIDDQDPRYSGIGIAWELVEDKGLDRWPDIRPQEDTDAS